MAAEIWGDRVAGGGVHPPECRLEGTGRSGTASRGGEHGCQVRSYGVSRGSRRSCRRRDRLTRIVDHRLVESVIGSEFHRPAHHNSVTPYPALIQGRPLNLPSRSEPMRLKSRMREICRSGSVGGPGGQPPGSTRHDYICVSVVAPVAVTGPDRDSGRATRG